METRLTGLEEVGVWSIDGQRTSDSVLDISNIDWWQISLIIHGSLGLCSPNCRVPHENLVPAGVLLHSLLWMGLCLDWIAYLLSLVKHLIDECCHSEILYCCLPLPRLFIYHCSRSDLLSRIVNKIWRAAINLRYVTELYRFDVLITDLWGWTLLRVHGFFVET